MQFILKQIRLTGIGILLLIGEISIAQNSVLKDTSAKTPFFQSNFVTTTAVPLAFFGATAITFKQHGWINRFAVSDKAKQTFPGFKTTSDNYLQYAPIAMVYCFDAIGIKPKNNLLNQTILLAKSEIIMSVIVVPVKYFTAVLRPDSSAHNSFPSGHTAQAMMAATFLHKEFGKDHPWISVLGYATATSVATLRVLNNRHWISDVLAGAGVGILSVNIAYLTHQYRWKGKDIDAVFIPVVSGGDYGISCYVVF